MFLMLFMLAACNGADNGDTNDNGTDNGDTVDNGTNGNDNGFVGDPYLLFDVTEETFDDHFGSWVAKFVREGPFDVSEAQEIFVDRAVENDGMDPVDEAFDFSDFGYPPDEFSNVLSFENEHWVSNYGFVEDGDQVEVTIVSVWRALYFLPNTMEEYLGFIEHPEDTEIIEKGLAWDTDIEIFARSGVDIEDIMQHYVFYFTADGWVITSNSLADEDNFFYDRDDRFQLVVDYDKNDVSFEIWIDITTPYNWEDHYKEGHSFINISFYNVVQYMHEDEE